MDTSSSSKELIESQIAYLESPLNLVFRSEVIDPKALGDKEVICESLFSAISTGTELAAYTGAKPLHPRVKYPRLVGYCNVARVLYCGKDVVDVSVGDRVLTFASHRTHFKITSDDILVVLPEAADPKLACCTYLFHLGYDALQKAQVRLGSPVVVIGLGVLGLASVATCVLAGAQVYAVGDQDKSRELALEFGARAVFRREQLGELKVTLGDRLADAVLTTSNMWSDWSIALQLAGMHGHISVLGFPGRQESDIPFNPLDSQYFYNKQLCVQAVGISPERIDNRGFLKFNERGNLGYLLRLIGEGKLKPQKLISEVWPGFKLAEAYAALHNRVNSPLAYVLQWQN